MVAFIPTSYAQEKASEKMSFVFSAAGYKSETSLDIAALAEYDTAKTFAGTNTSPWRVDGHQYVQGGHFYASAATGVNANTNVKPSALSWYMYGTRAWQAGKAKRDGAVALLLKIENSGTFTPTITYHAGEKLCIYDVYLVPKSVVEGIKSWSESWIGFNGTKNNPSPNLLSSVLANATVTGEPYYLGKLDMSVESAGVKTSFFPDYTVAENATGEYYLFFRTNGISEKLQKAYPSGNFPNFYTNIYSFDMHPYGTVERPKLSEIKITLAESTIFEGGSTSADVSLKLDNGDVPNEKYEIKFSSSDTSVATVDESTGEITAVSKGSTKITASVLGTQVSGEATLTVEGKPFLEKLVPAKNSLVFFENDAQNSSAVIEVSALMSNGKTQSADAYQLSFSSADESIATVTPGGEITAVGIGKTTIMVSAENENKENIKALISVEVRAELDGSVFAFGSKGYGENVEIEKADMMKKAYASNGTDPWRIVSGSSTHYWFSLTGEEGITSNANGKHSAPNALSWHAYGYRAARYTGADVNSDEGTFSGGEYTARQDMSIAILLDVSRTGEFAPAFTYEARRDLCIYDIYLVPKSVVDASAFSNLSDSSNISKYIASLSAADKEKYMLGTMDMYDGTLASGELMKKSVLFENITVEKAGEHYLLLQVNGVNENLQGPSNFNVSNGSVNYKNHLYTNIHSFAVYPLPSDALESTSASVNVKEIFAGDKVQLTAAPKLSDGTVITTPAVVTSFVSMNEDVATVNGDVLSAHKAGNVKIKVESYINGFVTGKVTGYIDLEILPESMTDIDATAGGSRHIRLTDKENDTVPLYVKAISNLGRELNSEKMVFSTVSTTPEIAEIVNGKDILPLSEGVAKFLVTAELNGRVIEKEISLTVSRAKSEASYMTAEKAAAARENAAKYDWAKAKVDGYIKKADKYVDNIDLLYSMIHSEGIARGYIVGHKNDPNAYKCRYCNVDLRAKYTTYAWINNALSRPWKTQCPDCKRLFPSNNFEGFYKLGLNEYGEFDRQRALDAHHRLIYHGSADYTECVCKAPESQWSAEWNEYYGYGVKGGYLYNELYPEVGDKDVDGNYKVKTINAGSGLRDGETAETWGVDDGLGYVPKMPDGTPYKCSGTTIERHTYIAQYLFFGVWRNGAVGNAIENTAYAYFYTGDRKYGRVAAILLDRVADFYPQYSTGQYNSITPTNGTSNAGKLVGSIWDTELATSFITAYDMVFDMYEDEYVLNYIRDKATRYKIKYAKETPSQIRTNIEDGIVRNSLESVRDWLITGNYGMEQQTTVTAAVVLDSYPESQKWLDFLMATGWDVKPQKTGGGIYAQLTDEVDADGQGDEGSSYNVYWLDNLRAVNEVLESNDKYLNKNLANHPKFIMMHYANIPLISTYYTPQIGDSSSTLAKSYWVSEDEALSGWKLTGDKVFAQVLYLLNGNSADGLHYAITEQDPERLEHEVRTVIEERGELKTTSEMMTNFGFAILRDGGDFTGSVLQTAQETRRDAWMYFGTNTGHAHRDSLNLGLTAFGLNFTPDLGYPEQTGKQPNRLQWVRSTLSHNTVMVDEDEQLENEEIRGNAKHFDDSGIVSLMDVDASYVYDSTEAYRRSVVTVRVDDENSYTVDFFRVLGGNDHLYSFHASSNEIHETKGLDFSVVEDEDGNYISGSQLDADGNYKGTYAGRDALYVKNTKTNAVRLLSEGEKTVTAPEQILEVKYGADPYSPDEWNYKTLYPRGYTWLKNVDRDTSPANNVEIDFAIKDFNKAISNNKNLHLRMTLLNSGNMHGEVSASVAIADGFPPNKASNKNIDKLKYVLVEHTGENLDTVFTAVFEPYRSSRYLKRSSELSMRVVGDVPEEKGDAHRAVKVEHKSGRVDYILYATNTSVTYEIDLDDGKTLSFRGFVGVYTINEKNENIYKYVHDGDIIGNEIESAVSIEAAVKSFTKGASLSFENEITLQLKNPRQMSAQELENLTGRYVFIDNGNDSRSGTFKIESASQSGDNLILDTGLVSPVRKYVDSGDFSKGFEYMISEGQEARIPLTYSEDFSPVFDGVSDTLSTSVGSTITVKLNAESPITENSPEIKYSGTVLPRGASINEATGLVTWKPDASQVGNNHFAVTALDENGRESTVHFYITVYGSTTSKPSEDNANDSSASSGTSGGSGGGGGGGAAPTPDKPETGDDKTNVPPDENTGDTENTAPDASGETDIIRFTDIANHVWAEDAINALATDGIIKGTSASTFSPSNNITRADFALLLVRAFKLESENAENFVDVQSSDYFAPELAIARNTGVVNGIGDNKYAPRNTITRQDMMVIVHRALTTNPVGEGLRALPSTDEVAGYPDSATVAPYARDAVTALIGAGFVNGKNGRIAPTDYTTRAEVAVLLKRILDYIK